MRHHRVENWRPISIGRSNISYCFSGNKQNYFIQIIIQSNNQFLPYERSIALDKVVTPKSFRKLSSCLVDTYFQSNEVRIQQWFESESLNIRLNGSIKIIDFLAKFLADLHSVKSIQLPNFDLNKHLHKYRMIALSKDKNKNLISEINTCLEQSLSMLKWYQCCTLCHYDLNLNNILINKKNMKIKIVDWEYVCIGDPILDLAAVIKNFELSGEQENHFISCYKNSISKCLLDKINISNKKLDNMKRLNQCIYQLWEYGH